MSSLFLRFERDLTMTQAAAELGFSVEEFTERLAMAGAEAFALKQRLEYNLVPRDQFVELFAELVNEITDHHAFDLRAEEVAAYTAEYHDTIDDPAATKTFNLAIYPNETEFKVGNELTFSVKAEYDCYLTLINVDEKYRTTVLFPNRFNENNLIKAGETYTVPSEAIGGFKLIFQDPGKETVIGKCNASSNEVYGIDHDFDASAYTTFDSYDTYVSRALVPRQIVVQEDTAATRYRHHGDTTEDTTTPPTNYDDRPPHRRDYDDHRGRTTHSGYHRGARHRHRGEAVAIRQNRNRVERARENCDDHRQAPRLRHPAPRRSPRRRPAGRGAQLRGGRRGCAHRAGE